MLKKTTYGSIVILIILSLVSSAYGRRFDDCDKYRRQGDSLFKACNYLAAIKKYKSCLILREKDDYSVNKIKVIDDIFNKMRIAVNLTNAGKIPEAIDIYRKVLLLNADDIEAKRSAVSLLEAEAEKRITEGEDEQAAQNLKEIISYVEPEKRIPFATKLKQLEDRKKNPEYLKIIEEGNKLMKAAKYPDAIKKFTGVFSLTGFQKDKQAQQAIDKINAFQGFKEKAAIHMKETNFAEAIVELTKILKEGVNDTAVKTELLKAYESQADKLLNAGKKDEAVLLVSKAIETFDGDSKRQNTLQKKLKELTIAKTTKKD
jgi:tetratricopeptide (TPR) repeat protein